MAMTRKDGRKQSGTDRLASYFPWVLSRRGCRVVLTALDRFFP